MPPALINVPSAADPRDAVHRAVALLAQGRIVLLPTETVYGLAASGMSASAVQRLAEIKQRPPGKAFALAVKSAEDALDYIPEMPPLARRLARRCWPGPVTLVMKDAHPDSVIYRLPEAVHRAMVCDQSLGLRVPAHDVALQVLRLSVGPLVLTSANLSGQPEAREVAAVDESVRDQIDLILDDGPCRFGQPSSVVRVNEDEITILREGVVDRAALRQLSQFLVLFVCTGNTCRSPMAERLFSQKLAERLGCAAADLPARGVRVESAGIAAFPGGRASREAVDVLAARQIRLDDHASQPISERLVRHADLILTMTSGHREAIIAQWPEAAARTHLLRSDRRDVSDPIGQPAAAYQRCADEIEQHLPPWLERVRLPPDERVERPSS